MEERASKRRPREPSRVARCVEIGRRVDFGLGLLLGRSRPSGRYVQQPALGLRAALVTHSQSRHCLAAVVRHNEVFMPTANISSY